jgi:hypothetical protein
MAAARKVPIRTSCYSSDQPTLFTCSGWCLPKNQSNLRIIQEWGQTLLELASIAGELQQPESGAVGSVPEPILVLSRACR